MSHLDWWIKLKQMVKGHDAPGDGGERPLPSFVMALCSSGDESAFSIEIMNLNLSGMRIHCPRRLASDTTLDIRVPVGLNFEDRNTSEYVSFRGVTTWSQRRAGHGFECGVRYSEDENDERDAWIKLVLETYGLSVSDDRRKRFVRHDFALPALLRRADDSKVEGEVRNLSMGGLQVFMSADLAKDERLVLELRPAGMPAMRLQGHVVHAQAAEGAWLYGIAFDLLDEVQSDELVRLVSAISRAAVAREAAEGPPSA